VFSIRKGVILLTYSRGPCTTSLAWGPVGHCTSGRPLNPPPLIPLSRQLWPMTDSCCSRMTAVAASVELATRYSTTADIIGSRGCYALSDPYCQSMTRCVCVCVRVCSLATFDAKYVAN